MVTRASTGVRKSTLARDWALCLLSRGKGLVVVFSATHPNTLDPTSGSPESFPSLLGEYAVTLEGEAAYVKPSVPLVSNSFWLDSALRIAKPVQTCLFLHPQEIV